ncbi:MAG: SDR family oxidoreductase [Oscillospiraceae bacterium]|jgi:NAD(P)-dependent dehydrogenase (short-subunit alcohol dehydrogenase family)|nr:SDR family oxidoreductase [Oscillospiraceae bacterium]
MDKMLNGQVALITGGTSGMGEAVARLFAREGAAVVIGGRGRARGEALAADITASGGVARYYAPLDVTSEESIKSTVDRLLAEFGRLDILAAFAGKTFDGEGLSARESYEKTMESNMTGTYNTVFAVLPHMKARKSGKIVICSSNGAFNPTTPAYTYHMAKAACESLTVNLAMELAPLGIRVNCIKPGPIRTSFWDELAEGDALEELLDGIAAHEVPMGRVGTADDIAGPTLFLASDLSAYITGLCLYVGGGIGYVYSHAQSFLLGKTPTGAENG